MASPQISQRRFPDPRTNNKIALGEDPPEIGDCGGVAVVPL